MGRIVIELHDQEADLEFPDTYTTAVIAEKIRLALQAVDVDVDAIAKELTENE